MRHAYPAPDEAGFVGLRYWAPPDHLKHYFGAAYLFTANRSQYRDLTRADMPQLRFMIAGGGHYSFHDQREAATPQVCMLGPTMGATRFNLDRPAKVLGIAVLPLGWIALGCESADLWSDRLYDAALVHGADYTDQLAWLRAQQDPEAGVERIWRFLEGRITPTPPELKEIVQAIDTWLSTESSPQVEALAHATGLSQRQIARYTNRLYGAPPKLLARKYRALRCAAQIVLDQKNWIELCEEGTFYDQPHFIREIKQFIGLTPHQLMTDPTIVARLTVQRRAMTGLLSELNRIS